MQVATPTVVVQQQSIDNLQSTPMVLNGKQSRLGLDFLSPITPITEQVQEEATMSVYSLKDISSWIGGNRNVLYY